MSYPLPLGFRHSAFGRTDVWGVEQDKCGCPDAWDCFTCLLVLCLSTGEHGGDLLAEAVVGEGRAGVQPWVGQKPFCCYGLEKTKIRKSHEANLGLGLTWKGEQSACRSSQCFPSPRLQHPNSFLCLLGCEDASFCRWDGSCRTYSLVLPSCESWMGAGLWPCCWDAVAVVATGWMPVSWAPAVCVGSSAGQVDLHP